jgi:hypothetical protein
MENVALRGLGTGVGSAESVFPLHAAIPTTSAAMTDKTANRCMRTLKPFKVESTNGSAEETCYLR